MAPKKKGKLSFEEGILEAERLIATMQSDGLSLDEMMLAYEKGSKLIEELEIQLANHRKRLEQIDVDTAEITPIVEQPNE